MYVELLLGFYVRYLSQAPLPGINMAIFVIEDGWDKYFFIKYKISFAIVSANLKFEWYKSGYLGYPSP
jgi:hypothetical protein